MSRRRCVLINRRLLSAIIFFLIAASNAFAAELAILKVFLNSEDVGEFYALISEDGDVSLLREDLNRTKLKEGIGMDTIVEGEKYVSLRSISGLTHSIVEKTATLRIEATPGLFKKQQEDASYKKPYESVYARENSAFLNYSLSYGTGASVFSLFTELGVGVGDFLAMTTMNYTDSETQSRAVRLLSSVSTDDRGKMRTYVLGDFPAPTGPLGSTPLFGGLNVYKNFAINPYFVKYPTFSLGGTLTTPSDVEVYVGDLFVSGKKLSPGIFRFDNIPVVLGYSEAEVVIKDALGRKTVVKTPFFFSDKLFKKGIHEYSYGAGFLREDFGKESFNYGKPAVSALHSYGFSDGFKGGYALEATSGLYSLGPTAAFPVFKAGTIETALGISGSEGRTGYGGLLRYTFISKPLRATAAIKYLSEDFSNLEITAESDKPTVVEAGIGYNNRRLGSISGGHQRFLMNDGPDSFRYTVSYGKSFLKRASVTASLNITGTEGADTEYSTFAGLNVYLGRNVSSGIAYNSSPSGDSERVSLSKSLPLGRGFGYRVEAEERPDSAIVQGAAQYQNNFGTYGLGYFVSEGYEDLSLSASGGIGYIGRSMFLSRTINDSFAKVKVGDIEGVRVYYSGSAAGTTNKKGEVIIPNLISYHDNRLSVEGKDIPVDYSIRALEKYVTSPYRSGSVIGFDIVKFSAVTGKLYTTKDGQKKPFEYAALVVVLPSGGIVEGMIGRDGEFYIENVPPGRHKARAVNGGRRCRFDIIIPDVEDVWVNVGEVLCEPGY